MGIIIPVANEKGGVGKTTTVLNLAYFLSEIKRAKVLVVDLDPQFNLTSKFFESKADIPQSISRKIGESNAFALFDEDFYGKPYRITDTLDMYGTSAHISLMNNCSNEEVVQFAANLNDIAESYEYVLIDCPPSVGNLQFSALTASTAVLIPTTAEADSIEAIDKVLTSVSKVKGALNSNIQVLGIMLNDMLKQGTLNQNHLVSELRQHHFGLVFENAIYSTTLVKEASTNKMSILQYDPKKADYINVNGFMNEFIKRVEELSHVS